MPRKLMSSVYLFASDPAHLRFLLGATLLMLILVQLLTAGHPALALTHTLSTGHPILADGGGGGPVP